MNSKTIKEIFLDNYPLENLKTNKALCQEALGYLRATFTFFPWLELELKEYYTLCYETVYHSAIVKDEHWEVAHGLAMLPLSEVLEIVEDATANGFEFKVEDHTLYFREIPTEETL